MVFDCGTNSKKICIEEEIASFYDDRIKKEKIDLLCVSHFDEDHVNCLSKLLENVKEVECLVLPYISIEKLSLTFFLDGTHGYNSIYTVRGRSLIFGHTKFSKIMLIKNGFEENEENWNDIDGLNDIFGEVKVASSVKEQNHVINSDFWEFDFFNVRLNGIEKESIMDFYDLLYEEIEHHIGRKPRGVSDFVEWLKIPWKEIFYSAYYYRCLIKYDCKVSSIKYLFDRIIGDVNKCSLTCFHKPKLIDGLEVSWFYGDTCHLSSNEYKKTGQMITGDIDLKTKYIRKQFISYYYNKLSEIGFMNVPHHGSLANWNDELLTEISANIWVVSHGLSSIKHPNKNVENDIISGGRQLFKVNEANELSIMINRF